MNLTEIREPLAGPDVFLLAQILNGAWGAFFTVTPEALARRLASGHLFVLARDAATPEETAYVRATYGLEPPGGQLPIGLLETIDAVTGGDARRVPSPFARLTEDGAWRPPLPAADTLVFVDLTTAASRRQSGIGRDIVRFALSRRRPQHAHVYTFTPNVEAIVSWHLKRGATHSGALLPGARPGYAQPDVAVMDYSRATPESVS